MCSLRVPGAPAHPPRLVFTIYNYLDVIILRYVSYGALEVVQMYRSQSERPFVPSIGVAITLCGLALLGLAALVSSCI